jgi:hypothetical protein
MHPRGCHPPTTCSPRSPSAIRRTLSPTARLWQVCRHLSSSPPLYRPIPSRFFQRACLRWPNGRPPFLQVLPRATWGSETCAVLSRHPASLFAIARDQRSRDATTHRIPHDGVAFTPRAYQLALDARLHADAETKARYTLHLTAS